ncbi:MAG: 3-hydroxyacyl-ACP dehydratase FabZ family protein [Candidatus Binatia bacterium]
MAVDGLTPAAVLELIPQQPPFRFVDEIHELDDEHVVASYRYRPGEFFYPGHFPGDPITPGVVLIETIAQAGVVALGIYLMAKTVSPEALGRHYKTLFTSAEAEFHCIVRPDERVTVEAHKQYMRRGKLQVTAALRRADGAVACSGTFAGMIVRAP